VVHFAAGEIAKKGKDDARALESYGKAAELDGSWSAARIAYADALARSGGDNVPKAIAQYEAVLLIDQNEGEVSRVKKTITALKKQQP
jgi:cytochrome c-type biogenesis protein CcmH/NrfG